MSSSLICLSPDAAVGFAGVVGWQFESRTAALIRFLTSPAVLPWDSHAHDNCKPQYHMWRVGSTSQPWFVNYHVHYVASNVAEPRGLQTFLSAAQKHDEPAAFFGILCKSLKRSV